MPSKTAEITGQQIDILEHASTAAARGYFCGDSPDMQVLVASGLMVCAGKVSWCPDPYFRITDAGRQCLKARKD